MAKKVAKNEPQSNSDRKKTGFLLNKSMFFKLYKQTIFQISNFNFNKI